MNGQPKCVCPPCFPSDKCYGVKCPENGVCVDGVCQCEAGYVYDKEGDVCVKSDSCKDKVL